MKKDWKGFSRFLCSLNSQWLYRLHARGPTDLQNENYPWELLYPNTLVVRDNRKYRRNTNNQIHACVHRVSTHSRLHRLHCSYTEYRVDEVPLNATCQYNHLNNPAALAHQTNTRYSLAAQHHKPPI